VVLKRNGCDSTHLLSNCEVPSKNTLHKTEAYMVPQQLVINNVIEICVLQEFSVTALHCAVTNKQIHEVFNRGKKKNCHP